MRSERSKLGTAAIAALPTRPVPPLTRSARRDVATGVKMTANARAAAARPIRTADSGCSRGRKGKPPDGARDDWRGEVGPGSVWPVAHGGGESNREGQHTRRGEQHRRI